MSFLGMQTHPSIPLKPKEIRATLKPKAGKKAPPPSAKFPATEKNAETMDAAVSAAFANRVFFA